MDSKAPWTLDNVVLGGLAKAQGRKTEFVASGFTKTAVQNKKTTPKGGFLRDELVFVPMPARQAGLTEAWPSHAR